MNKNTRSGFPDSLIVHWIFYVDFVILHIVLFTVKGLENPNGILFF